MAATDITGRLARYMVEVTLRDGRTVSHFTRHTPGTKENPPDTESVNAKARILMEPVLGAEQTEGVIRRVNAVFDDTRNKWVLKQDATDKIIGRLKSKADGTRAGVLRKLLGRQGGTVVIRTKTGVFDEERNFPQVGG